MNLNQVTLPCLDIAQSRAFYLGLGFTLIVDSAHYLRFYCEDGGATFSLHLSEDLTEDLTVETTAKNASLIYFECPNLDTCYQDLCDKGVEFVSPPTDQTWAWREARLFDPSGNQICLYHAGENRVNPPWRVTVKE